MNIDKVTFYNLGDLEPIPGHGENGLVRIPKHIRKCLNERARFVGKESVGVEIRFVTDAPIIDIYISATEPEFDTRIAILRVYKGNHLVDTIEMEPGVFKFYRIQTPPHFRNVNEKMFDQGGFSPNVWRVVCDRPVYILQGIDVHGHEMRPPKIEELPKYSWLAYGSSITNANLDGYVHVAAAKLRVQVQNKGLSGACHMEKELIDYMLDECDSDFMTFELGINMAGWCEPNDFKKRAEYLVERLVEMKKPAVLISAFPNRRNSYYAKTPGEMSIRLDAYEQIMEELVQKKNCKTLAMVKGEEILSDIYGLRADMLHPTVYGSCVMGLNLAKKLEVFMKENELQ